MGKHQYYEFEGFQNIFLEDSFVLEIQESPGRFVLNMEVVLTEKHPLYALPSEGEQYCYKKAAIVFSEVEKVSWEEKKLQRFFDANGEYDLGNIDTLYLANRWYHLAGDWGYVKIQSSPPNVAFQLTFEE